MWIHEAIAKWICIPWAGRLSFLCALWVCAASMSIVFENTIMKTSSENAACLRRI